MQQVTLVRKVVGPQGRDVEYHFSNGRVRKFATESVAREQMAQEILNQPDVAEAWAIVQGVADGETLVMDPTDKADPVIVLSAKE